MNKSSLKSALFISAIYLCVVAVSGCQGETSSYYCTTTGITDYPYCTFQGPHVAQPL
jgi:hypothetical protein